MGLFLWNIDDHFYTPDRPMIYKNTGSTVKGVFTCPAGNVFSEYSENSTLYYATDTTCVNQTTQNECKNHSNITKRICTWTV